MKIRLWLKLLMCHLHLAAGMVEFCKKCGVRQPLVWHAADEIWEEVSGQYGVLCPSCFDERADKQGILLVWKPTVEVRDEQSLL